MNSFKVKEEVLVAILRYLLTKPMSEVEQLVQAIRSSEKIKEPKPDLKPAAQEEKVAAQ